MHRVQDNHEANPVADEALRWFVRMQSGEVGEQEEIAFRHWLAQRDAHRNEYDRLSNLWTDLDELVREPFPPLQQALAYWDAKGPWRPHATHRHRPWALVRVSCALAAMLAVVVASAYWWTFLRVETAEYRTAKGEQRTVELPDGSTVVLNTQSSVSIRFSGNERTVLLKEGEALFTAVHDTRRPFAVVAENGTTRDIGTQFVVRTKPERVVVAVTEGSVEVATQAGQDGTAKRSVVRQGQGLWYDREGRLSQAESVDVGAFTAWLHGKLVFQAMPLADVLRELSRYHTEEIRLLDAGLAEIKVSGVFNSQDLTSFLEALEDALPVTVTHVNPRLVIVERAVAKGL